MADYSKVVAWSGKDALADSDAAKVISGADFHTEFSAVETAVNTKADINGDASEAFSATTAASGTNTTQVATTAFVQAAYQAMYPVGSIYMNAAVATNPATLLGFGTWAAYAEGRVPVGKASSGTFNTLNATGGAETDSHTLTTSEIPAHSHKVSGGEHSGSYDYGRNFSANNLTGDNSGRANDIDTSSVGGGAAHTHDILQPYIVVYMWKRTA
jgi:hypothetical protein